MRVGRDDRSFLLTGLGRVGSDRIVSFPAHAIRDLPLNYLNLKYSLKKNNVIKYTNNAGNIFDIYFYCIQNFFYKQHRKEISGAAESKSPIYANDLD